MDLLNTIQNLIRRALVTGGADNSQNFPVQQITYLKKVSDCAMLFPYGMYANATSDKDTLVTVFSIAGNEEDRIGIPQTPLKRPRDLQPGEVAFYHPNTETSIKYRNNGDLEIDSGNGGTGNIIINCAVATINATTSITFDTPIVTFTGDVQIDANLNVDGATTLSSTVTSSGTDISNTHTHPQGLDSANDIQVNTGAPV